MTAQIGCLHFDPTDKSQWDVPAAMIGGLPIAVIDRARSAELMIDVARKRRGTGQRPLVFTSANGQVLSICARDPQT
jgi:N-acetylglucosaminyldiphosphoundecaprenol N-acetyl-beta-D-mannosaminyltransferase